VQRVAEALSRSLIAVGSELILQPYIGRKRTIPALSSATNGGAPVWGLRIEFGVDL
jgi:hypothetical protein